MLGANLCPQRPHAVQGNVLRRTKGIQMLPHLEELDLRCNLIASINEVVRLSGNIWASCHSAFKPATKTKQMLPVFGTCGCSPAPRRCLEVCA